MFPESRAYRRSPTACIGLDAWSAIWLTKIDKHRGNSGVPSCACVLARRAVMKLLLCRGKSLQRIPRIGQGECPRIPGELVINGRVAIRIHKMGLGLPFSSVWSCSPFIAAARPGMFRWRTDTHHASWNNGRSPSSLNVSQFGPIPNVGFVLYLSKLAARTIVPSGALPFR